jgi:hypothetical protein
MAYEVLGQTAPAVSRLALPGLLQLVRKPPPPPSAPVILSPIFPGGMGPSTSQPPPPTGTAPAEQPPPPSNVSTADTPWRELQADNGTLLDQPSSSQDVVTESGVSGGTIALWLGGGLVIIGGIGYLIYDYMKKHKAPAYTPMMPAAPAAMPATQVQNPGTWLGRVYYQGMHDFINYADLVSTIGYDMGGEWASSCCPFGAGTDYVEFAFDNNRAAIDFATAAATALEDNGARNVKAKVRKLGR